MKERNKGKLPTDELFRYCKKELFHAQWSVLLSRDLKDAMRDGMVIVCPDGQQRCFYPRIMTYSADYPEKYASAFFEALSCPANASDRTHMYGLRSNGTTPCHCCLTSKAELCNLGAPIDTKRITGKRIGPQESAEVEKACEAIRGGYSVKSKHVEDILQSQSLAPVQASSLLYRVDNPAFFALANEWVADCLFSLRSSCQYGRRACGRHFTRV
jgi:hypothetical protein